jgi:DNA-binding beta-propeller fold protein YncE
LINGFNTPTRVARGPSGDVYVTDHASVTRVTPDGTPTVVTSDPVLNRPHGIAVDENEVVYVASAHDGNIYRVDQGTPATATFLAHVDGLVQQWACGYMHYHAGALYITNGDNKTHRIPTATGEVQDWAGNGNWGWVDGAAADAEFMAPNGIWVTPDERVFVAEYGVQRIRIIEPPATSVEELEEQGLERLGMGRPNPFTPATTIDFSLKAPGHARLTVFDAAGRQVRTLLDDERAAGPHDVTWNGRDDAGRKLASGVYFYRLEAAGGGVETRKVTLLR